MAPLEVYTHAGLTIEIHLDDSGGIDCPLEYQHKTEFITFEKNSTLSDYHDYSSPDDIEFPSGSTTFPLYKYAHGQAAYSIDPFSCPWDSGQVGMIVVGSERDDPEAIAEGLCEQVTAWCNGEIYGYIIKDGDGEELDSCWGFLGDSEHCKCEAEMEVVSLAERITKKSQERLKVEIKNHVPLERRDSYVDCN